MQRTPFSASVCLAIASFTLQSCGGTKFAAGQKSSTEQDRPHVTTESGANVGDDDDSRGKGGGTETADPKVPTVDATGDQASSPGKDPVVSSSSGTGTTTGGASSVDPVDPVDPVVPVDPLVLVNTTSSESSAPEDIISSDLAVSKYRFLIPRKLTAFYKKFQGSTNFYGKVQGDGPDSGAFTQIKCPGGAPSGSGTAVVTFMILVKGTWTKFHLGDAVPVDPAQPIYAKLGFDTHMTGGGDDNHFTADANIDIRSYFGPHPTYPNVSIGISTPGSPGSWRVGIGRGKDGSRHPPTPDNTYMSPAPDCG